MWGFLDSYFCPPAPSPSPPSQNGTKDAIRLGRRFGALAEMCDTYRDISMVVNIDDFLVYNCIFVVYREPLSDVSRLCCVDDKNFIPIIVDVLLILVNPDLIPLPCPVCKQTYHQELATTFLACLWHSSCQHDVWFGTLQTLRYGPELDSSRCPGCTLFIAFTFITIMPIIAHYPLNYPFMSENWVSRLGVLGVQLRKVLLSL